MTRQYNKLSAETIGAAIEKVYADEIAGEGLRAVAVIILTDFLHWCDKHGLPTGNIVEVAQQRHWEEVGELVQDAMKKKD
jgi:hypothetical protein